MVRRTPAWWPLVIVLSLPVSAALGVIGGAVFGEWAYLLAACYLILGWCELERRR